MSSSEAILFMNLYILHEINNKYKERWSCYFKCTDDESIMHLEIWPDVELIGNL